MRKLPNISINFSFAPVVKMASRGFTKTELQVQFLPGAFRTKGHDEVKSWPGVNGGCM